jgi:FkbM family methyltransferase
MIGDPEELYVADKILNWEEYFFSFNKDDIVLDLWANIWAFSILASNIVKQVIALEPNPKTFEKLKQNVDGINNITIINWLISDGKWLVDFFPNDRSVISSSFIGINPIKIESYTLQDFNNITKIKCDIEWWEYKAFIWVKIPSGVNEIWFEIHLLDDYSLLPRYNELKEWLLNEWFSLEEIKNDINNVTYLLKWKR